MMISEFQYLSFIGRNIVACQAHPALVKIGPVFVPLFILDSPLARIHVLGYSLSVYYALCVSQALALAPL